VGPMDPSKKKYPRERTKKGLRAKRAGLASAPGRQEKRYSGKLQNRAKRVHGGAGRRNVESLLREGGGKKSLGRSDGKRSGPRKGY